MKRYTTFTQGNGAFVTITRISDKADVFLQGDDADEFLRQFENAPSCEIEDYICSQYDDVMQVQS